MPHRLLLRICFFGYFVIGLVITVIGPVIAALQEVFGLTRGEVGAVFVAQGVGYGLAVLIGGILSDLLGRLPVLVAGHGPCSAGFLAFGTVTTWPVALLFFFVASAGAGIAESAINSLAVDLGTGARGRILNLLHFFPATGAVVGPYSADLLLPYGWSTPFLFIGGMLFFLVLVLLAARRQVGKGSGPRPSGSPSTAFQWQLYLDARLLTLAALLALYVGAEASITGWTVSYVVDALEGIDAGGLHDHLPLLVGTDAGACCCARLSQRMDYLSLTAWMGGLAGGACIASLLVLSTSWLGFFIFAAGVLAGVSFPPWSHTPAMSFPAMSAQRPGLSSPSAHLGGLLCRLSSACWLKEPACASGSLPHGWRCSASAGSRGSRAPRGRPACLDDTSALRRHRPRLGPQRCSWKDR